MSRDHALPTLWMVVILLVTVMFLLWTVPAHAEPAPEPPSKEKPVILKIYPKLLPVQPGEEIIRDPNALPEGPLPEDPHEAAKDPRTWA